MNCAHCCPLQGEEGEEGFAVQRERFPPGRIVWARVEGHEFWPARIVRRRAGGHDAAGASNQLDKGWDGLSTLASCRPAGSPAASASCHTGHCIMAAC